MVYWKPLLHRLAFSLAWVVTLTGLGGFVGALAGMVIELALQALVGVAALSMVVPALMLAGSVWAFLWAMRVVLLHRQPVKVPSQVA